MKPKNEYEDDRFFHNEMMQNKSIKFRTASQTILRYRQTEGRIVFCSNRLQR